MQEKPMVAPSRGDIVRGNEAVLSALMYHQNKECAWMANERTKSLMKTKPETVVVPAGSRLI